MAWNEPGNRGETPWGKKRPAGKSGGGLNEALKDWQQRLQSILGGPSGNTPVGGGDAGEPSPRMGLLIAGLLFVLWIASGVFQIDAGNRGVIQRFGSYTGSVRGEGVGIAFPWPIDKVTKVNVSAVNSVEYRSKMLTADVN